MCGSTGRWTSPGASWPSTSWPPSTSARAVLTVARPVAVLDASVLYGARPEPILGVMAVDPIDLSPELREIVERARRAAEEAGELLPPGVGPLRCTIPVEAREAIIELLRDGTYAAAVARIAAEDPDLADE